jgi:hypothetical protein
MQIFVEGRPERIAVARRVEPLAKDEALVSVGVVRVRRPDVGELPGVEERVLRDLELEDFGVLLELDHRRPGGLVPEVGKLFRWHAALPVEDLPEPAIDAIKRRVGIRPEAEVVVLHPQLPELHSEAVEDYPVLIQVSLRQPKSGEGGREELLRGVLCPLDRVEHDLGLAAEPVAQPRPVDLRHRVGVGSLRPPELMVLGTDPRLDPLVVDLVGQLGPDAGRPGPGCLRDDSDPGVLHRPAMAKDGMLQRVGFPTLSTADQKLEHLRTIEDGLLLWE